MIFSKRYAAPRPSLLLFAIALTLAFHPASAHAQAVGHYLPGITGLENGSATPPGAFVTYLPYINHVDALKGFSGTTLLNPDINITAHNVVFSETLPKKFLGGTYGWSFIVPVVNTRFTSDEYSLSAQNAGVSDVFFSPVILGWEKGQANFTVNYGFYAPTGQFDPDAALNAGLGFWEHQIELGATYALDKHKLWNASALTTWEINMSKEGLDVRPGPMLTGEYSFGRRFFKYQMNAGLAGYGYTKLSGDAGSGVNPLFKGLRDRSFGIGPEWKYTNLKWHLGLDARYEYQFGVQGRTSGPVFVVGVTWLSLFPPSKP